jgi:hypothetical protein
VSGLVNSALGDATSKDRRQIEDLLNDLVSNERIIDYLGSFKAYIGSMVGLDWSRSNPRSSEQRLKTMLTAKSKLLMVMPGKSMLSDLECHRVIPIELADYFRSACSHSWSGKGAAWPYVSI